MQCKVMKCNIWVVVKIMVPVFGVLNIRRHLIFREGTQKRTIILTTTHILNP